MNCISWNCRGLGNQGTVQELARLVREKDPSVLFLSETWTDEDRLEVIRCRFHFSNKFVVKRINKGGGLVLYWKHDVNLTISSYSLSHIDTIIDGHRAAPWRFTCFYGAPETHLRENSWNLLRTLKNQQHLPWCCVGDFNEIIRNSKKSGRRNQSERQMQGFWRVIDECGFIDLGFRGFPFTWCNNRRGNATTWLRLDKFMATNEWVVRFHTAVVHHLDSSVSDHKPIWLNTYPIPGQQQCRRPFQFEDMWRDDPTCEPTITTAWIPRTQGSPMVQVQERISWCSAKLKKWVQFGNVTQQLKEKTDQLHWVEERSVLGHGHDSVISIRKEVQELLIREEKMWRQRSRTSWLKEGDRNTKYFHSRASHRRRCNSLVVLRLENGDIITEAEQIGIQFVNYYQELFTVVPLEGVDGVIEGIQPRVMAKMNRKLTCQFTELDVTIAMKQMAPLKAPGPDGMPPIFYQSY
jgi:hypothetical protein